MRSEADKWKVPESDPAGHGASGRINVPGGASSADLPVIDDERGLLIFCGMCGALNPTTSYYCAACGSTLVDAFHATEGLRVFERPDAASRIIDIVPTGATLDINEDPDAPSDYVRVRLENGKLGYIRLAEVAAMAAAPASGPTVGGNPDINTNARGCVSTTGALASLALLILLSSLAFYLINQEDSAEAGFLALVTCMVVAPLCLLMIILYLMARDREDRTLEAEEEALLREE
ncbi:MAG: SH3 domain-containing protein [Thermomicrobiales bacterium]|nr:SH3 domain-containing protein [Thermomicrobiales bacterium]